MNIFSVFHTHSHTMPYYSQWMHIAHLCFLFDHVGLRLQLSEKWGSPSCCTMFLKKRYWFSDEVGRCASRTYYSNLCTSCLFIFTFFIEKRKMQQSLSIDLSEIYFTSLYLSSCWQHLVFCWRYMKKNVLWFFTIISLVILAQIWFENKRKVYFKNHNFV